MLKLALLKEDCVNKNADFVVQRWVRSNPYIVGRRSRRYKAHLYRIISRHVELNARRVARRQKLEVIGFLVE